MPRDFAAEKRRLALELGTDEFAIGDSNCQCALCLDWLKQVESALDAYADKEVSRG